MKFSKSLIALTLLVGTQAVTLARVPTVNSSKDSASSTSASRYEPKPTPSTSTSTPKPTPNQNAQNQEVEKAKLKQSLSSSANLINYMKGLTDYMTMPVAQRTFASFERAFRVYRAVGGFLKSELARFENISSVDKEEAEDLFKFFMPEVKLEDNSILGEEAGEVLKVLVDSVDINKFFANGKPLEDMTGVEALDSWQEGVREMVTEMGPRFANLSDAEKNQVKLSLKFLVDRNADILYEGNAGDIDFRIKVGLAKQEINKIFSEGLK